MVDAISSLTDFGGLLERAVDAKNRVALPVKRLESWDVGFVCVLPWPDGCLAVKKTGDVAPLLRQAVSQGVHLARGRRFHRLLASCSTRVRFDDQGRVILTEPQKQHARIENNEVYVLDAVSHIEIWSRPVFDAYNKETAEDTQLLSDMFAQLFAPVNATGAGQADYDDPNGAPPGATTGDGSA